MAEEGDLIKKDNNGGIEEESEHFDYLDLNIDLRKRLDLREKMTPEMRKDRQRKQLRIFQSKIRPLKSEEMKIYLKKKYNENKEKMKEMREKLKEIEKDKEPTKMEETTNDICPLGDFDYLDLSIDLRKRPDLIKRMTPEMRAERKKKRQEEFGKKFRNERKQGASN